MFILGETMFLITLIFFVIGTLAIWCYDPPQRDVDICRITGAPTPSCHVHHQNAASLRIFVRVNDTLTGFVDCGMVEDCEKSTCSRVLVAEGLWRCYRHPASGLYELLIEVDEAKERQTIKRAWCTLVLAFFMTLLNSPNTERD